MQVCSINIRGLGAVIKKIRSLVTEHRLEFLAIQETKLKVMMLICVIRSGVIRNVTGVFCLLEVIRVDC